MDEKDDFEDELFGDSDPDAEEFILGEDDDDDEGAAGFAPEGDDDGGVDEDDDEDAEVRTAVLSKSEMLALLSLKTGARGGLLVRVDPRQPLPSAQTYEDSAAALRWFRRSLATSRRNGWHVVYEGAPLFG